MKRVAKLCTCGGIIDEVCDRCGRGRKPNYQDSSAKRGYDRQWRNFRTAYMKQRIEKSTYYCDDCEGLFTPNNPGPELHHIAKVKDNPRQRMNAANILMLHESCHAKRTARGE